MHFLPYVQCPLCVFRSVTFPQLPRLSSVNRPHLWVRSVAPPSARWLLQKGRTREAEEVLLGMARSNGLSPIPDINLVAAKQEAGQTSDHCCSLFTRCRAALWTLVLCFNWYARPTDCLCTS